MKNLVILSFILFISASIGAQAPGNRTNGGKQMPTGSFYGKLVDSKTEKPIEYASVQLVQNKMDTATKKRKDVVINGMITKANGQFLLENVPVMGQYKLKVTIVGFKSYEKVVSFDLKPGGDMSSMMSALDKDLGNIKIEFEEKLLENVTVTATKPGLQLGIDRKIFNVDKNVVSAGGTAIDIMRNVPSLNVDIDGNVTMRNNSPQIFVDGRPTTMTLDQIPADAIESVELITNPSAKFDASGGTAGILNIVLKKNKKVGYSGSLRANLDSRGRIGTGGDINIRQQKVNFFLSGNYNQRKSIGSGYTDRTTFGTPNSTLYQLDSSLSKGWFGFFRGGFDYLIDNRNTISVTGNMMKGTFRSWSESDMNTSILSTPATFSLSDRNSFNRSEMRNKGVSVSYKHNFPKTGHEWTADLNYNANKNASNNLITTDSLNSNYIVSKSNSQRQLGNGGSNNLVIQTDYANPLTDKMKLEAGARISVRNVDNRNYFYLVNENGSETYLSPLSVNYNSTDRVYAAYTTFSNQLGKFGYQAGLRVESSSYEGRLPDKNQVFNVDYAVSLFPSLFLNQKLKKDQELQLNYSRKINRPNFFQLYPYTDYSDSLNITRGNPDLKPEFTNSLELTYQKTFKNRDNFIASMYYKNTTDLIARYQLKENNAASGKEQLVNSYINANSGYVTGLELISKNKMAKWWDMTSNLNLFTSKINITDPTQPKQDQFASWFFKLNNTFKLPKNFTLQLSGDYTSRTVLAPGGSGSGGGGGRGMGGGGGMWFGSATSSQGYTRANYGIDGGIRYEFMKNKVASVSLNVNDIFRTRRQFTYSESAYFQQDVFRRRDPQVLRLNFSWRFGKFDASLFKRKNQKNQDNGGEMMGGMGQ
jgi:outer membrane receptor protein involved in Fe transport